jgi:amidase
MHLSEYTEQDATGLSQLIKAGHVSADEVRTAALRAIEVLNPQINAVIETWDDERSP